MILGIVLAGGQSRRFGSDKALASFEGQTLLARAVDGLSQWCEQVVVTGREEAPAPTLPDWPKAGMGPLGGIAAGLHYAADMGFEQVLSVPVDTPRLPQELLSWLSPEPAYLAQQPVVGLWPVSSLQALEELLRSEQRHSMRAFADLLSARRIELDHTLANINTPVDLEAFSANRS